jgi:hypothetical protein
MLENATITIAATTTSWPTTKAERPLILDGPGWEAE